MKKKIAKAVVSIFLLIISLSVHAQKNTESTYFISANAYALIDSHRDLVSATNTGDIPYATETVSGTRRCVAGAMPGKGYGGNISNYATFTSYFWKNYSFIQNPQNLNTKIVTAAFHTVWFSQGKLNAIFGDDYKDSIFIPKPIVCNGAETHLFSALFVPVKAYQNSGLQDSVIQFKDDADYIISPLVVIAVNSGDIKSINEVTIESPNGYMNKRLPKSYNNKYSSIGVVVEVVLNSGETKKCYVFNNHEVADSRLLWKYNK